jgi:DNA polymerase III epsilon subunit-like protein
MVTKIKKPKGYFDKIFAIDCETTGLKFDSDDPSIGHQSVSWGVVVANAQTLKPIEKLYVEIKWSDASKALRKQDPTYGKKAESIHGLTMEYLEEHGVTETEAVEKIGALILKHWGPENCIRCLGHNVATFDIPFLRRLFRSVGIELKFGNRHYDTNTVGFVNWETFTSDELFNMIGFADRTEHNALVDAVQALETARITRLIFQKALTV